MKKSNETISHLQHCLIYSWTLASFCKFCLKYITNSHILDQHTLKTIHTSNHPTHTARDIPAVSYAPLWLQRFVSLFAGTLKLHSPQLEKCLSLWTFFYLEVQNSFQWLTLGCRYQRCMHIWRGASAWKQGMSGNLMHKRF